MQADTVAVSDPDGYLFRIYSINGVLIAALVSANCLAMENVKRGQRGEAVKEVQEMLISLGYLDGAADGAFGPGTEAAVGLSVRKTGLPGAEQALSDAA